MALTKNDLSNLKKIIEFSIEEKVPQVIKRELSHLPTKDDFYKTMDKIMGELKTIREEQILLSHRTSDHEDRLEKLEKIHPSYQHL